MTKPMIDASKLLGFRLILDAGDAALAAKVGAKVGKKDTAMTVALSELVGAKLGVKEGAKVVQAASRA